MVTMTVIINCWWAAAQLNLKLTSFWGLGYKISGTGDSKGFNARRIIELPLQTS